MHLIPSFLSLPHTSLALKILTPHFPTSLKSFKSHPPITITIAIPIPIPPKANLSLIESNFSHTHPSSNTFCAMENNNNNNNQIAQSSSYPLQPTPPPPPPPSSATPFHHLLQQQQQQLQMFWSYQRQEIEQVNDFKNHQLPLARIKKIMKADEDVRMISAEAPILFAKACELFILELTIRSWLHAEENKRRTLQKNDIAAAITRTDIFDFLVDIVPRDEIKDEAAGLVGGIVGATASGVPYYYPPMGQPAGGPHGGMMIGRPAAVDPTGGVYVQPPSNAWQSVWQGHAADDGSYGSGASSGHGNLDGQS